MFKKSALLAQFPPIFTKFHFFYTYLKNFCMYLFQRFQKSIIFMYKIYFPKMSFLNENIWIIVSDAQKMLDQQKSAVTENEIQSVQDTSSIAASQSGELPGKVNLRRKESSNSPPPNDSSHVHTGRHAKTDLDPPSLRAAIGSFIEFPSQISSGPNLSQSVQSMQSLQRPGSLEETHQTENWNGGPQSLGFVLGESPARDVESQFGPQSMPEQTSLSGSSAFSNDPDLDIDLELPNLSSVIPSQIYKHLDKKEKQRQSALHGLFSLSTYVRIGCLSIIHSCK